MRSIFPSYHHRHKSLTPVFNLITPVARSPANGVFISSFSIFIKSRRFHLKFNLHEMNPLRNFTNLLRLPKTLEIQYSTKKESLKLDKVLVLNKLSRLELERLSQPDLSEKDLEENIRKRGLDYDGLVKHNEIHKKFQEKVLSSFEKFGITVKTVNRLSCTCEDVEWSDVVFPVGGDGTYLHAARYISDRNKPVIGFNSDPSRSEGFLCLPKTFSTNVASALEKLIEGKFRWMFRTRIRVNFIGECTQQIPTELHAVKNYKCKLSDIKGKGKTAITKPNEINQKLPILALNEVFMSEVFTAKVSYFEMRLNNFEKSVKIKSSGLCVCTGTGSTSWSWSINSISRQDIKDILMLYHKQTNEKISENFEDLVTEVSNNFNEKLKFGPEEPILGYTVRDFISLGVWPNPKGLIEPRGFANTIEVKSRCLDAGIIVDGGISFSFNEGAVAFLEIRPEDALRTVVLLN